MSNVKRVIGDLPEPERKICDMEPGENGYTVPWAFEETTGYLNPDFFINEKKGGTASLWVECVAPGQYAIEFEEAEYRNLFS